MSSLHTRHIVVGVTGGIAAYKSVELVRRLTESGAKVRVVMTGGAQAFVSPLTFQAVSGNTVGTRLLDTVAEAAMGHIELARWADAVVIAPASANTLARLAAGLADDLLSTLCLATEAPLAVAPAMNTHMWSHAATQANVECLRGRGVLVWGPGEGDLACGENGPGRMLEPDDIVTRASMLFGHRPLEGIGVLVTAGPTHEALDPVRYLANRSSGRMGYALAEACADAGARVTLVSGPTALPAPHRIERIEVESAQQMHAAVMDRVAQTAIIVGAAAVADYRPESPVVSKIKKSADKLSLSLVRNPDILAEVAAGSPRPLVVGFAAETDDVERQATQKLEAKGLDMVCANRVGEGEGFGDVISELRVMWPGGHTLLGPATKQTLAHHLVGLIAERFHARD